MATAELAVAMPAVILVGLAGVWAIGCAVDTIRCVDAARATARLIARGDPTDTALAQGRRLAPSGAQISVATASGIVEVRVVRATSPGRGPWGLLTGSVQPSGDAVAALEAQSPPDGAS